MGRNRKPVIDNEGIKGKTKKVPREHCYPVFGAAARQFVGNRCRQWRLIEERIKKFSMNP